MVLGHQRNLQPAMPLHTGRRLPTPTGAAITIFGNFFAAGAAYGVGGALPYRHDMLRPPPHRSRLPLPRTPAWLFPRAETSTARAGFVGGGADLLSAPPHAHAPTAGLADANNVPRLAAISDPPGVTGPPELHRS